MQDVRALCDRHGILFISDEVICAFGRLGTMFGHEKYGYLPAIVTMAKGLSSAYQPIGGCLVRDMVADAFMDTDTASFAHSLTFGGHPVAAAVALTNLEIMIQEGAVENVAASAPFFRAGLDDLLAGHPCVGDVRDEGYFMAIEPVKDKDPREPLPAGGPDRRLRRAAGGGPGPRVRRRRERVDGPGDPFLSPSQRRQLRYRGASIDRGAMARSRSDRAARRAGARGMSRSGGGLRRVGASPPDRRLASDAA